MPKRIPITKGYEAIVDDEDYEWLMQWKWHYNHKGYAMRTPRVPRPHAIMMHRLIMDAPEGVYVDHINGNGLDNRKENLRLATHGQNRANSAHNNKNGYKGVRRDRGRWVAQITFEKKVRYLGSFGSLEEAALAYNKAALELHGEFAFLNEIGGGDNSETQETKSVEHPMDGQQPADVQPNG